MDADGMCWPSVATLARASRMTTKTVGLALQELEREGFLDVEWSRGRSSHRFQATLPPTASPLRGSEWNKATTTAKQVRGSRSNNHVISASNHVKRASNHVATTHEASEASEAGALAPAASQREHATCNVCHGTTFDDDGTCITNGDCNGQATYTITLNTNGVVAGAGATT